MIKIEPKNLIKISVIVLMMGLLVFTAKNIYDSLSRAAKISEELVESYRPHLDVELIKKAAEILKNKK